MEVRSVFLKLLISTRRKNGSPLIIKAKNNLVDYTPRKWNAWFFFEFRFVTRRRNLRATKNRGGKELTSGVYILFLALPNRFNYWNVISNYHISLSGTQNHVHCFHWSDWWPINKTKHAFSPKGEQESL